jgi:hypothetical protein
VVAAMLATIEPRACAYGIEPATHRLAWPSGSERYVCLECCMAIVQSAATLQGITLDVSRLDDQLAN